MTRSPRRVAVVGALVSLVAGLGLAAPTLAAAGTSGPTFSNFEPAGLSSFTLNEGGGVVGTTCPGAGAKCYNTAAEPAIRADEAGNFYASSENGLGAGTEAWKSTDGGRHYTTLPSPDAASNTNDSGFAPGGGDTDLAVGDDLNSQGNYSVFVASLNLASIDVANSTNGGHDFTLNPVASRVPVDDREWIAADDSHQGLVNGVHVPVEDGNKVCLSYHDIPAGDIHVDCSYDGGLTFTQTSTAIDPTHAFLIDNNMIGNMQIARDIREGDNTAGNHNIYQVFSGPGDVNGVVDDCGLAGTCYNTVWFAVSKDGGVTFTDIPVYRNPKVSVTYGHQFVNVSVDRKGNIYVVYTDNHNMFYSYSRNQGSTWSGPYQINKTPSNTSIEPWSVAGDSGKLDVVWYGTSATGNPETLNPSATWHVYFAQNTNVFSTPKGFTQVAASPVNHTGAVCEGGISCTGNRDLYDDFGIAASPTTGLASIVYSDDQHRSGNTNNPNSPHCSAATTNTGSCDHTAFATQLSGTGIITP